MKLKLFNYNLPQTLIAQTPAEPRDHSRLLIYNRKTDKINHEYFFNLPEYLTNNDVLVFNNSKVMPARLLGQKSTGGRAEILLLKQLNATDWEVLIGTNKPKIGLKLLFERGLIGELINNSSNKTWVIRFNFNDNKFNAILCKIGQVPLPPYISNKSSQSVLNKQYQTVYAKNLGSSAAPTAGLHFTKRLLTKIKNRGVAIEFVTLHVGLGTFNPVDTENIEDYKIHQELISVDKQTVQRLIDYKKQGKKIIAVGTTSVRTLETIFQTKTKPKNILQQTDIFIYPGYKFKFVDAIITNFHLPKSSLLMLISAFVGRIKLLTVYKKAVKLKYRFFSFGDAMFFE